MPRWNKRAEDAAPIPGANVVAAPVEPPKVIRSREEQAAHEYTEEFLKNNRMDLTGIEKKLTFYGERAGWVRRWPLDQGSRLQTLLARGWRFVLRSEVGTSDSVGRGNTDIGDQVSVVTTAGDGPVRQVLMEIPQKLYDLYTQARTEPARATEEAIRKGAFKVDDSKNVYIPGERPGSHHFGARNSIESKTA